MNENMLPCPDCNSTGFVSFEDRHTRTRQDACRRCCGRGTIRAATGESPDAAFVAPDPLDEVRQQIAEGLAGFVNDPPDTDFQEGYQAALFVVATEILGMDPGPSNPTPDRRVRPSHLRLVSNGDVA